MIGVALLVILYASKIFSAPEDPRWKVTMQTDGNNNVKSGTNNIQYGTTNVQHGSNNIQFGANNVQHGSNNFQDGNNNVQTGSYNKQIGNNNVQHGAHNDQSGDNNRQDGQYKVQHTNNDVQLADSRKRRSLGGVNNFLTLPVAEDIYFSKGLKDSFNDVVYFKVESNDRTRTKDNFQDVNLVTLTSNSILQYSPNDTFMVRPRNCQEDVNDLFRLFNKHGLDIEPGYKLQVEQTREGMPVPQFLQTPLTVHRIAEQYWDLKAYPTQSVFPLLARIADDKVERDRCIELSSPEGQADLLNYSRRTVLEVLNDFPKTASKLNVSILFELFSTIKPESFTIASSNLQSRNSLDVLAALEYRTNSQKGLCSNWLAGLRKEDGIYGWIQKQFYFTL